MLLKKVALVDLLRPVLGNPQQGVGALAVAAKTKWDVVVIVNDCNTLDSGRFLRSAVQYVDDPEKKNNYATMLRALFSAVETENYQAEFKGTTVVCKRAHSFSYASARHTIWELKLGKKDRVYFCSVSNKCSKLIVLLMAFHKKDQTTPVDVTTPCEKDFRSLLTCQQDIPLCPEKTNETHQPRYRK